MVEFGKNDEFFAALIGDVVRSRDLPDRAQVQRDLESEVDALSDELGAAVAAPLALTAGDEVQVLLRDPGLAPEITIRLTERLFPIQILFGLGWGPLSTDLGPHVARLDGPCFHRARAALEAAGAGSDWLRAEGFGPPHDAVLTSLFQLMGTLRRGWTEKQARTVRHTRSRLQKDVAAEFGVSPSVVSESLRAAGYEALRAGEEAATHLLTALGAGFGFSTEAGSGSSSQTNPGPNTEAH